MSGLHASVLLLPWQQVYPTHRTDTSTEYGDMAYSVVWVWGFMWLWANVYTVIDVLNMVCVVIWPTLYLLVCVYICELPPTQLPNMLCFYCANEHLIQSLPKKVITAMYIPLPVGLVTVQCWKFTGISTLMSHKITYCDRI